MLEVLDTAGQEEYTALRDQWIRDGEAFMLVYSVSSRSSFTRIRKFHAQVMRVKEDWVGGNPIVTLVGNKCDREGNDRDVLTREGFALAKELGCDFFETSSKNFVNVEESFFGLVRAIREQRTLAKRPKPSQVVLKDAAALSQNRHRYQRQNQKPSKLSSLTGFFRSTKSLDSTPRPLDVNQQISMNRLLVQIAQRDKRKTARRLLGLGADPNGDSGVNGSPLYAAAALGHSKMVALLLDSGAAVNAKSTRGSTPLIIAAAEGHTPVVHVLLDHGASTDVHGDTYGTPLVAATFRCHAKVLRLLLQHGAKVNDRGGQYDTALHAVAMVGNVDIATILLDAGADVTLRDRNNSTALQVAAGAGHAELVRLLLLRGARSLIDDTKGKHGSALKAASDKARFDVMKILLEAGAKEETLNPSLPPHNSSSDAGASIVASPQRTSVDSADVAAARLDDGISTGDVENLPLDPSNGSLDQAKSALPREDSNTELLDWISFDTKLDADPNVDLVPAHALENQRSSPNSIGVSNSHKGEAPKPPDHSLLSPPDTAASTIPHYDYSGRQTIPWQFISRLGQGSCSTIEEIEPTDASVKRSRYARKMFIVPPHSRKRLLTVIQNEVNILAALRHDHVAAIHSTYCTEREFAIVMSPVADMNLGEYLAYNSRPTGDSPIYSWFGCLATAFDYLHERKIKHQDVKPANILIRDGQIIVADFGVSKDVLHEATTGSTGPDARTLMYCAPEAATADSDARRGRAADIFSLGCVFLEMVTTLLWMHGCSVQKLHDLIQVDDGPRVYSASLVNVLRWILMLYAFTSAGSETASNAASVRTARASCIQALQWCLAMLLADADSRITAHELRMTIDHYQTWLLVNPGPRDPTTLPRWAGHCCYAVPEDLEDLAEARVLHSWPDLTLDAVTLGYAPWNWDDIKGRMAFRTRSDNIG